MSRDRLRERIRRMSETEGDIKVIALEKIKSLSSEFGLPCKEMEQAALEARVLPRR